MNSSLPVTLEECVAAFEAAVARDGQAPLREFVPAPGHPDYARVVRELVRVDLELGWSRGQARGLDEYRREFPDVFDDPEALAEVAFEEYRQRREHGDKPSRDDYRCRYGIDTRAWPAVEESAFPADEAGQTRFVEPDFGVEKAARAYQEFSLSREGDDPDDLGSFDEADYLPQTAAELFREAHRDNPEKARKLARAVTSLPEIGGDFLEFRLVDELGRGAFGRVFLAEQTGLANRRVALKISTQLFDESQTLAQLQHTNIVPIYSVHQRGPLQAVCMPYFGSLTLADVTRDLSGRAALPVSGDHLVSTLRNRKSTARSLAVSSLLRNSCLAVREDEADDPAAAVPEPRNAPTLTDALSKLKNYGYVEAVLWLGGRLADALAHAHERGICHRDLKPANVLLTDEGQPMLLDFNLSDDQNQRRGPAAARVGGTLPYMAPEHLEAFQNKSDSPDARSDLYSLGLILYELLTGKHPYPSPSGSIRDVLPKLIANRRRPSPPMRPLNRLVSPAVEAIVRRCLEHDPARRYQTAVELREDIERHLAHLPLKHAPEPSLRERAAKFRRRHPLMTSSATLGTLAVVLVLGLGAALVSAQQRYARLDASNTLVRTTDEAHATKLLLYKLEPEREQLAQGMSACRNIFAVYPLVDADALGRLEVRENPNWENVPAVRNLPADEDRRRLGEGLGEVLLMYARAVSLNAEQESDPHQRDRLARFGSQLCDLAEHRLGASRAAALYRAQLSRAAGKDAEARDLFGRAESLPLRTARDHFLVGLVHLGKKEFGPARQRFQEATRLGPQDFLAWFNLGMCHAEELRLDEAADCLTASLALAPKPADAFYPYANRGLVYLRQSKFDAARADLTEAMKLRPDAHEFLVQRGIAAKELAEWALRGNRHDDAARLLAEAERDFSDALSRNPRLPQAYYLRAAVRDKGGDTDGAAKDREAGARTDPSDVAGWIDRGYARLAKEDAKSTAAALADFEQALKLNPRAAVALQNKAHVLGERLGRNQEAVAILDKAIELYPGYVAARLGRGVLLARLGQRERAHADARAALVANKSPATYYQVANIYALTSKQHPADRDRAYPLLSLALQGGFGLDVIDQDSDMDPIRDTAEFRRLVQAARDLQVK